jgi:UDP-N-acetylmuramyl tripeptide synthase
MGSNKATTKKPSTTKRLRNKFLSAYYGHPEKDLKIIAITGATGAATTARFIYEIIHASGEIASLLISPPEKPLTATALHKFLSRAWRQGANFVVVEAPPTALTDQAFANLPIHIAIITDLTNAHPDLYTPLLTTHPDHIILNRDDPHYDLLATHPAKITTTTFGRHRDSLVRIDTSKLYKKGAEAHLIRGTELFEVATFIPGEQSPSLMAAAATAAKLLNIPTDHILDGIAAYEPTPPPKSP